MTKLLKALVAHNVGCVCALGPVNFSVTSDISKPIVYSTDYIYDVRVTIGAKVVVPPCQTEDAKRKAWELINYEVFGEFHHDIHAIRAALYEQDIRAATTALNNLHDRMFRL